MIRRAALSLAFILPATTAAQQVATSPDSLPRFIAGPCPIDPGPLPADVNIVCGILVVPETHRRPHGPTIRLAVTILRPTVATEPPHPAQPPVVMLHGGPGNSGIGAFLRIVAASPLPRLRDVVIYDQRGTGFSPPVPCEDFGKQRTAVLETEPSLARAAERIRGLASSCMATLRAQNVDASAYSTAESAADLVDLRRVLGYSQWDVYGTSYGTRLALAALALDSAGIRSVVLDRAVKPGPWLAERARRTQSSLNRVFRACARDGTCHAAFPGPERDLMALFRKLENKPLRVPATGSQTAAFVLDGEKLMLAIHLGLSSPRRIAGIPFLLRQLRAGDELRAARELAAWISSDSAYPALASLVNCNDQYGAGALRLEESTLRRVSAPPKSLRSTSTLRTCDLWTRRFDDTPTPFPTGATNPVLIISAEFDPTTPPGDGEQIAAMLPNARHYELPGESHSGRPIGCHAAIVVQFMRDPSRVPDTSCIAAMPPIHFVTRWEEMAAAPR